MVGGGGIADNGIQDGTELGIPGVTMQLWSDPNGDGQPTGWHSAADNRYRFNRILPLPRRGVTVILSSLSIRYRYLELHSLKPAIQTELVTAHRAATIAVERS